jgi:nitric oxide reductase activation protein
MAVEEKPKRSTVYLDAELHRALKVQAAETQSNMSELINRAVRDALREDRDDLAVFDQRGNESVITFEEMLKRLELDGKI